MCVVKLFMLVLIFYASSFVFADVLRRFFVSFVQGARLLLFVCFGWLLCNIDVIMFFFVISASLSCCLFVFVFRALAFMSVSIFVFVYRSCLCWACLF